MSNKILKMYLMFEYLNKLLIWLNSNCIKSWCIIIYNLGTKQQKDGFHIADDLKT